jgi:histidyl-tRNA synthetase
VSEKVKAPRGTYDALPGSYAQRAGVYAAARETLGRAGYGKLDTPVFESTELFARGVGESTDIVQKEMFTFEDKGERSLTLRPEGTAPVARAYLEHGMRTWPQPVKLWYWGPFFRHERPQAGRYRQFNQVGAEAIGSDSPLVDAELVILLDGLLRGLGVPDLRLRLGSLGSVEARADYLDDLRAHLRANEGDLSEEVRERIELNPLRAFDVDDESTQGVMAQAPVLLDRLEGDDAEHFETVKRLLDDAGVAYQLDGSLVRGLDYYTRTIFSFECDRLGAQSEVGGGGRYDALVEQLGGPPTPAAGWAAGVERILLALDAPDVPTQVNVFIVAEDSGRERALTLANELRAAGIAADLDLADRSIKGQMKQANRSGAAHAVLLTDDGAELRDMDSGAQRPVAIDSIVKELGGGG